ncbi:hypothetical protein R4Z09_10780 [Niallia oryzisoli]|uniref:Uncharacterized protein n=1 Tax=Niallia oryzisoli TaxID=1737571 RepID=A0ABZ2CJZ4_9BACI
MTFEVISLNVKPRSLDGLLEGYYNTKSENEYYKKRLIKAYIRQNFNNPPRWFVESAAEKDWTDKEFEKMLTELEQFERDNG